jgi:hypothetical protein
MLCLGCSIRRSRTACRVATHFPKTTGCATILQARNDQRGWQVVGTDSPIANSRNLDREDQSEESSRLVELLEFEITQIRSEESRPGWSTWALLGGLATIAWLFTFQIEADSLNLRNTLFVVLGLSLIYDSIAWVRMLIEGQGPSEPGRRFEFTNRVFSEGRCFMLFEAGRSVAMMVIASAFRPTLLALTVWSTYLFYGGLLVMTLVGLSVSYLRFPVPKGTISPRGTYSVVGTFLVLAVLALYGVAGAIWGQHVSPTVHECRIAGLLAVGIIMVRLLARGRPRTPLLKALVDIRRALGLTQIDVESARRQTEIALAGMTVGDAFQVDVEELLSQVTPASVELRAAASELAAGSTLIGEGDSAITEGQRALLDAVMSSTDKHVDEALAAQERFSLGYKKVQRRLAPLYRVLPGSRGEIVSLMERLLAAQADLNADTLRVKEELSAFCDQLESLEQRSDGASASEE